MRRVSFRTLQLNKVSTKSPVMDKTNQFNSDYGNFPSGLTFLKRFQEGTNELIAPWSSGSNKATFTASRGDTTPATTLMSQKGNALLFDGVNDFVDINSFSPSGSTFTFCFRVKSSDVKTSDSFLIDFNSTRFVLAWFGGTTNNTIALFDDDWNEFGLAPSDNLEHTLIFEVDGTSAKAYLDNVQLGSTVTITAIDISSATDNSFGAKFDGGLNYFEGVLRDIRVFNRVLTTVERNTYERGESISTPIAHWDFSDGSGSTLTDIEGSDNGTITGAKWLTNGSTYVTKVTAGDTPKWTTGYYATDGVFTAGAGLMFEGSSKNLLTDSVDFTDVNWTKTNISVTADGDDGPGNISNSSADTITADANNATILQAETISSSTFTFSIWLKRKTGTGNIDLTVDGGSTYTTKTLTTAWKRFELTQAALANPSSGIRIVTSGDEVYAWGTQLEDSSFPSSFIPTTTATLTRNAETLTYVANDGNFPDHLRQGANALSFDGVDDDVTVNANSSIDINGQTGYSVHAIINPNSDGEGDLARIIEKLSGSIGYRFNVLNELSGKVKLTAKIFMTGNNSQATSTNTEINLNEDTRVSFTFNEDSDLKIKLYVNGILLSLSTDTAGTGTPEDDSAINLVIGNNSAGDRTFDGSIKKIIVYQSALTQAQITTLNNDGTVSGATAHWNTSTLTFGATTLPDFVGSNDGTITGAVVVGTKNYGTIALVYRPIMLPDEQAAQDKNLFLVSIDTDNNWVMKYDTNANDQVMLNTESVTTELESTSSAEPFGSSRYSLHSLISTYSTTQDASSKDSNLYVDGLSDGSNADYTIPSGSLPTNMEIQPNSNQSMILVGIALFNRRLNSIEVKQVHNLLT